MPLYYSDPEREPRECPGCDNCCECEIPEGYDYCPIHAYLERCKGTSRLGEEGAEADVEVSEFTMNGSPIGYFWRWADDDSLGAWKGKRNSPTTVTPFGNPEEALAAARAAVRGD